MPNSVSHTLRQGTACVTGRFPLFLQPCNAPAICPGYPVYDNYFVIMDSRLNPAGMTGMERLREMITRVLRKGDEKKTWNNKKFLLIFN